MTIVIGTRQLPPGRAPGGGEENADLRALASGIFCHFERQPLHLQPAGDGVVGGLEFGVDRAERSCMAAMRAVDVSNDLETAWMDLRTAGLPASRSNSWRCDKTIA
jgi:hypothetical protein